MAKYLSSLPQTVMLLLVFVCGILLFTSFTIGTFDKTGISRRNAGASVSKRNSGKKDLSAMSQDDFWKKHNFMKPELPSDASLRQDIQIDSKTINIMGVDTFYREASVHSAVASSEQSVLFLHGAAFTSKTWLDLGTIKLMAQLGHRVIAVDLPGKHESGARGEFLSNFVNALNLQDTVIVSPSMSGSFSLPYIFQMENSISGFIPVAPVNSEIVREVEPNKPIMKIPTLIIYGQRDTNLGTSSKTNLLLLENSQAFELPDAGHPAYLDQPKMFHTLVHNFLTQIKKEKTA